MIEIKRGIDTSALHTWLKDCLLQHLTPDVSNYAKGRLRAWLRLEPPLGPKQPFRPGVPVKTSVMMRLGEIINWDFDYCLVTYSGAQEAVGITPHRDSSFADYEAYGLNVFGDCKFSYWNDRESFGKAASTGKYPYPGNPSHVFNLSAGDLVRFNCKNVHCAEPSVNRWNMNFWKSKPGTNFKGFNK